MIGENIIPRNVIINRGAAEVDNHISRDDIFDYHPLRECNIYFIKPNKTLNPLFSAMFSLMPTMMRGSSKGKKNAQPLIYICMNGNTSFDKNILLLELITDVPFYKFSHKS